MAPGLRPSDAEDVESRAAEELPVSKSRIETEGLTKVRGGGGVIQDLARYRDPQAGYNAHWLDLFGAEWVCIK